jgi:hypothetical protein
LSAQKHYSLKNINRILPEAADGIESALDGVATVALD